MIIHVTKSDIAEGDASFDSDPITIALRRSLKNNKISVGRSFIRIPKKRGKSFNLVNLPDTAQNFMLNYHKYFIKTPITFEISNADVMVLRGKNAS